VVEPKQPDDPERLRLWIAFALAVSGLLIAAGLVVFLVSKGWGQANDVVAVVGLFTSLLGTLVGLFFGLQIGANDRARERRERQEAEARLRQALAGGSRSS
jgi:hypothetical protein